MSRSPVTACAALVALSASCAFDARLGAPAPTAPTRTAPDGPPASNLRAAPPAAVAPLRASACVTTAASLLPTHTVGAVFQIACPNCQNGVGGVWGTDTYTFDSAICRAALHAGASSSPSGVVTLQITPAPPVFRGSRRNGNGSWDWNRVHPGDVGYVFVEPSR